MGRPLSFVLLLTITLFLGLPGFSAVVFNLYNSTGLIDLDDSLLDDGSLVQLVYAGADGLVDIPDPFGNPGGDDSLATFLNNPTSIGVGIGPIDTGLVDQFAMTYGDVYIGDMAYVRFWNGFVTTEATHYGESVLFTLPAGDTFDQADFDFMSTAIDNKVDTAFTASGAVPEPSTFALLCFCGALLLIRIQYKKVAMSYRSVVPLLILTALQSSEVRAQLPTRLDVLVSLPMVDASGSSLPGTHPSASTFGFSAVDGAFIQVLHAGPDGVAGVPDAAGHPTGDDTVLQVGKIGEGIAPNIVRSGKFSLTLDPAPVDGAKIFVRLFSHPSIAESSHWGQSSCFVVQAPQAFVVDQWGLWGTNIPKHGNLGSVDSDQDGASDLVEFFANTNASDSNDVFQVFGAHSPQGFNLSIEAKPGRAYRLLRSTNSLLDSMTWTQVGLTQGPYISARAIELEDVEVLPVPSAFYRIEVLNP